MGFKPGIPETKNTHYHYHHYYHITIEILLPNQTGTHFTATRRVAGSVYPDTAGKDAIAYCKATFHNDHGPARV